MAILLEYYDHSQLVEAAGEYHPYSFLLNAAEVAPDAYGHAMNDRGVSDSTVYELLKAEFGKLNEFSGPVFTYESYQDSFYATSNKPYHVRTLGDKRYELTNHLGNVLAVVSDRKIAVEDQGNPGTVEYYEADVVSAQDYYPFGMIMPGRSVSSGEYRYGLHGMEMDNEWSGDGNHYTTHFRQYDPRIGRWMSLDPEMDKLASYSPYNFNFNNPLYFNDPDGDMPPVYEHYRGGFSIIGGQAPNHAALRNPSQLRLSNKAKTSRQSSRRADKQHPSRGEGKDIRPSRNDGTIGDGITPLITNPGALGGKFKKAGGVSFFAAAATYLALDEMGIVDNIDYISYDDEKGRSTYLYEINEGDNLNEISSMFEGSEIDEIIERNEIADEDHIEVGDTLEIEAEGLDPDAVREYFNNKNNED